MRRWEVEIVSSCLFVVTLFVLASCGSSKSEQFYQEGGYSTGGLNDPRAAQGQAIPNEAKFDFWLADAKSSAQHTFNAQNVTECQLAKDPNTQMYYFSVGFADAVNSVKLKVFTDHNQLGANPITDTQTILGSGKNTGTITIVAGEKYGNYFNGLVAPNQSDPIQSQCNVNYTISQTRIHGDFVCNSLVNGGNQRASGIINFSCAIVQPKQAQVPNQNANPIQQPQPQPKQTPLQPLKPQVQPQGRTA